MRTTAVAAMLADICAFGRSDAHDTAARLASSWISVPRNSPELDAYRTFVAVPTG